jgi:excisionase family DNA binding protein
VAFDGRLLHTIHQAAMVLSLTDSTIKRLIKAGQLRPVHIRSTTRIPQWEVERYARSEWAVENGLAETPPATQAARGRRRNPPRRIAVAPRNR